MPKFVGFCFRQAPRPSLLASHLTLVSLSTPLFSKAIQQFVSRIFVSILLMLLCRVCVVLCPVLFRFRFSYLLLQLKYPLGNRSNSCVFLVFYLLFVGILQAYRLIRRIHLRSCIFLLPRMFKLHCLAIPSSSGIWLYAYLRSILLNHHGISLLFDLFLLTLITTGLIIRSSWRFSRRIT